MHLFLFPLLFLAGAGDISELDALRIENAQLRAQLVAEQFERQRVIHEVRFEALRAEYDRLRAEVCAKAGLAGEDCEIDLAKRTARAKVMPEAKPASAPLSQQKKKE